MSINLTEEQQYILDNCTQSCYVSAAPGSGKSTMLSKICEKLLANPNNKVMLITFTNKASESIVGKCANLDKARIISGTFHGIAYRLLRKNGASYSICDEHKKQLIIKTVFNCRKDKEKFEQLYDYISSEKSKYPVSSCHTIDLYNAELKKYNLIDFDDIILEFIRDVSKQIENKSPLFLDVTHVLCDELQDTSAPQLEMLKRIVELTNCTIIGSSDDDQCIYSWRGARPENVQDFINIFKCKVMNMGTNFRSDKKIVEHAVNVILNNKNRIPKTIRPHSTKDGKIFQYKCANQFDQIDYLILKCQQNPNVSITILYRNRMFKYHIEFALRKNNLKYRVNDFLDITDRSAVRVMICCLKIASNQYDIFDLEQAAKALKGLGTAGVKALKDEADKDTLEATVTAWLANPKKQKKLSSVKSLQDSFTSCHGSALDILVRRIESVFLPSFDYQPEMRAFLIDITKSLNTNAEHIHMLADELGLNGSTEEPGPDDAKIELSTVHGYKGCEADVVIMPFCEQYERQPNREYDIEAERRLFYVAITRAKSKLYMSYSNAVPTFIKEMKL